MFLKICGEGQLHRYGRELGGQDALLHTFKMLTEKFYYDAVDLASLDLGHHLLKCRTVKIGTRIAVVHSYIRSKC